MPEYLAPGVFVEEVSFRAKSIEGVSTSTCGFVGPTRKGPIQDIPELITNFGEFERTFGSYTPLLFQAGVPTPNYMTHAVWSFFENGGRRLYVARTYVPRADNAGQPVPRTASHTVPGTFSINARHPGSGYNGMVHVYQKTTRIAGRIPLSKAKPGALIRVSTTDVTDESDLAAATPAQLDGGQRPFF